MELTDNKIKEILFQESYISEENVSEGEKYLKENDTGFVDYLLGHGIITEDILGQALGEHFGVPYLDLAKIKIDEKFLNQIPEEVAKNKKIIATQKTAQGAKVGMMNPEDLEIIHLLEKKLGARVLPYFILEKDFKNALSYYRVNLKGKLIKIFEKTKNKELSKEDRDNLIVQAVDLIIELGQQSKASDIHIEPYYHKFMVRFRIDGVLHDILDGPQELKNLILSRIKILARMRTDEHRAAQDGKIKFEARGEKMDIRVSIVPVSGGENVVLRLLSTRNQEFTLPDIGLKSEDLEKVRKALKYPHGMVLVTGPTGSGKTTTLYSMLKVLNRREVHISTIEDPVEYDIESISQIQVNTKTNLTFAKGLRAIVRQDPDIIMVGEIRDEETAGIAVNSAMTGHLVLSTLHTNDAATALPRLLDMNIEPFLISSTISVVIAQRLVRKICPNCRASYQLSGEELKLIKNEKETVKSIEKRAGRKIENIRFYKSPGCNICSNTGYVGRIGVFEVLYSDEEIRRLIVENASSDQIMKKARDKGMTTMFENGIDKVLSGTTTLEEVLRVSKL